MDIGGVASFCKSLRAFVTNPVRILRLIYVWNCIIRFRHVYARILRLIYVHTGLQARGHWQGRELLQEPLRLDHRPGLSGRGRQSTQPCPPPCPGLWISPGRPSSSPVFRSVIFTNITLFIRIHTGLRARGNWRGRELLQQPPHLDDQIRTYTSTHIRI